MENKDSQMNISKQFSCSKEKLFAAWTSPEQLKQWWKPLGKQLKEFINNDPSLQINKVEYYPMLAIVAGE